MLTKYKMMSHEEILRMQNDKLSRMVQKVYAYHPYYRQMFKERKLKPYDITTISDLSKLPFTTKNDLAKNPKDFVLQPTPSAIKENTSLFEKAAFVIKGKSKVIKQFKKEYKPCFMVATSGRTSTSTPVFFSKTDLELYQNVWAADASIKGIQPDDIFVSLFPYAPHLAFWMVFFATLKLGNFGIHTGAVLGIKRQIEIVQELKITWLAGMPTYIYYFLQKAKEIAANFSNVRGITTGGERLTQGLRKKIEDLVISLGGKGKDCVRDGYGIVEAKGVSMECYPGSGYHANPEVILWEVVDEKTGRNLGFNKGGAVALTHIAGNGTVLLRYLVGDTLEGGLTYDKCPHCGLVFPRLIGPIGRSDEYTSQFQITKIKGTTINLNNLLEYLSKDVRVLDYLIVIEKVDLDDEYSLDKLVIKIILKDDVRNVEEQKAHFKDEIKSQTEVTPEIIFSQKEELYCQLLGKTKGVKIIDNRKKIAI